MLVAKTANPYGWSRGLALLLLVGIAMATPGTASGQPPGQAKQLEQENKLGDLIEIGPGWLQLRLPKGGNAWQARPAPNAKIEVSGTASRDMLQPKQFITCAVTLDEAGKVTAPAAKVVFPDGGAPGVVPAGIGVATPGAKRLPGKRPAGDYLVAGSIKRIEGDVVTVIAGRETFEITVPAEAELLVQSANVGLATPGDDVEVEGFYYQQGQLMVTSLKVALANPVAPPPPKTKGRPPAP